MPESLSDASARASSSSAPMLGSAFVKVTSGGMPLIVSPHPSLIVVNATPSHKSRLARQHAIVSSPSPDLQIVDVAATGEPFPERYIANIKCTGNVTFVSHVYVGPHGEEWIPNGEIFIETRTRGEMDRLLDKHALEFSSEESYSDDPTSEVRNFCAVALTTIATRGDPLSVASTLHTIDGAIRAEPIFVSSTTKLYYEQMAPDKHAYSRSGYSDSGRMVTQ